METGKEIVKSVLPELVKGSTQLVNQFYQDLAQPTVKTIGKTLGTTFEFATIPALALGFATEKVKANFAHRLEEYKKKLDKIPEEDRCVVEPEIGEPIIRNLMNTTNDQIADLFTTLLANASNIKTLDKAHPKFAQIVQNMTPDEALIIQYLKGKDFVCYVDFRGEVHNGKGYVELMKYVTKIDLEVDLSYPRNINAYISNFISVGILQDMVVEYKADNYLYEDIEKFYYPQLEQQLVPSKFSKISTERSFFKVTDFGKLFIDACIA